MLPRSVARSLSKAPAATPCKTCICSCGANFNASTVRPPQRRTRKTTIHDAHPSVWRQRRQGPRVVSRDELQMQKTLEQSRREWHLTTIEHAERVGIISASSETIINFLNAFAALCEQTGYRRQGASPVDVEKLRAIIGELDENDCNWAAHSLLHSPGLDHKVYGRKLLFALSHLGSDSATISIMRQALVESKQKTQKLNATEIQHMRKHLKQIADQGKNFRAMMLEGKIQYKLGDQGAAIQQWTAAMEPAVAYGKREAQRKAKKSAWELHEEEGDAMAGWQYTELETPWIELALIHFDRGEWAKLRWALDIGCEMDDPTSHYLTASMLTQTDEETGGQIITSAWFYHMTKAAATGHAKAAHELGNFYASSQWPFLDDEPPDHIKPTPFDRYPPEDGGSDKSRGGFVDTVRQSLGLAPTPQEEPHEAVFRLAMFPTDPEGRMRIALHWLKIAANWTYAPSNLLLAQLYLEKTLWASAATPKAALDMTDERYTYATKADYAAGKSITKGKNDTDGEASQIPNPFYDPTAALAELRSIFHASTAQKARTAKLAEAARARKMGRRIDEQDVEEFELTERGIGDEVPDKAKEYLRFSEVREMYSYDDKGILVDDTGLKAREPEDIVESAMAICEEMGWDVWDEEGALMFRHGMVGQGKGSQAAAAAGGSGR